MKEAQRGGNAHKQRDDSTYGTRSISNNRKRNSSSSTFARDGTTLVMRDRTGKMIHDEKEKFLWQQEQYKEEATRANKGTIVRSVPSATGAFFAAMAARASPQDEAKGILLGHVYLW